MNGEIDVSICIVNWNGREVLGSCLASLGSAHDGLNVEIIVVDNASTDGSVVMVGAEFPHVILIRSETNQGFAAGNNIAAARASGRLLYFLNNDTIVPSGSMGPLVKTLEDRPEIVAVGPRLMGADDKPQRSARNLPTLRAMLHANVLPIRWIGVFRGKYRAYRNAFDPLITQAVPQLAAAAIMVRADDFKQIGGWDEAYAFGVEDVDFCLRLSDFAKRRAAGFVGSPSADVATAGSRGARPGPVPSAKADPTSATPATSGAILYLAEPHIVHLGRVSSHLNRGHVFRSYQCGFARYLRKHHRSRWAPLIYKVGVTIDAPIRWLLFSVKTVLSRIFGRSEEAARSWQKASAVRSFIGDGLLQFWRA